MAGVLRDRQELKRLQVPCIGWIYSQQTIRARGRELRQPLIIWWMEPMPPKFKKRKLYYSYLDEPYSPLRTNLSSAIRRSKVEFGDDGFDINCTNTYKYVYAVPKIKETRAPLQPTNFAGMNLWTHYQNISYIPSYIADDARLLAQGLIGPGDVGANLTTLQRARDSADEQYLYRNIVISTCQPETNPNWINFQDAVCRTTARNVDLANPLLENYAEELLWSLDVFMQYLLDNTIINFQRGGVPTHTIPETTAELLLAEYVLFGERDYRITLQPAGPAIADAAGNIIVAASPAGIILVTPPLDPTAPVPDITRRAVLGLRSAINPPPWIRHRGGPGAPGAPGAPGGGLPPQPPPPGVPVAPIAYPPLAPQQAPFVPPAAGPLLPAVPRDRGSGDYYITLPDGRVVVTNEYGVPVPGPDDGFELYLPSDEEIQLRIAEEAAGGGRVAPPPQAPAPQAPVAVAPAPQAQAQAQAPPGSPAQVGGLPGLALPALASLPGTANRYDSPRRRARSPRSSRSVAHSPRSYHAVHSPRHRSPRLHGRGH